MGKARAFLDAKTKAVQAESYAKCSYEPYWVLSCHNADKEVVMGEADAKGDIIWNECNVQAAFGLDVASMNRELRSHKRA